MDFASRVCDFSMQSSAGFRGIRADIYKEVEMNCLINCSKDAMSNQISHCLPLGFRGRGYCTVSAAGIGVLLTE